MVLSRKAFFFSLSAVTVLASILRAYGLNDQTPLDSEIHMAQGAYAYVEQGLMPRVMWWHAPLRNILMYLSMESLGAGAFGVRFWSFLLGAASVPVLAMLVMDLLEDRRASLIAAFLLALDPLHITFSRQAIQETHVAFFALLGVFFVIRYVMKNSHSYLLFAGIAFGLGMASKWQAGFALAACWLILIFPRLLRNESISAVPLTARLFFGVSSLVLLPAAVYALSYLPWILRGYGPEEWLYLQEFMFRYTATTTHDIVSNPGRALDWFIKPSGYASMVIADGPHLTLGINNLIVWWLVLPSFAFLAYMSAKEKMRSGVLLSMLFWFSYIPLALMPTRPIYLLSATSVIPFAFIGVAWAITDLKDRLRVETGWVVAYMSAVIISSSALYPLTCGKGLDYTYLLPIVNRFSPH